MQPSSEVGMIAFVLFAAFVLVRGQGKRLPFISPVYYYYTVLLLLLTLLSTLLPLALAGGSTSPRDFNKTCVDTVRAGEFLDSQQTFADLDLYDGFRTPDSIYTVSFRP